MKKEKREMSSDCCGATRERSRPKESETKDSGELRSAVQDMYGKASREENPELCCPTGYTDTDLEGLPDAVVKTSFGCGNPTLMAELKGGETVVDLGSGAGIDCFIAAKKVGPKGKVIGVDMTDDMLAKANSNNLLVAEYLGYDIVEFKKGFLEALPVADDSVDLLISNCVINLSPDKGKVFSEMARVLKRGGHFVVSDIVSDKDIPDNIRRDRQLWGECISGAVRRDHFLQAIEEAGFYGLMVEKEFLWRMEQGVSFLSVTIKGYR